MKGIFITGTDTGVGKTIVTGCLARYLSGRGCRVITQKWIHTGCDSDLPSDIRTHLKLTGLRLNTIKGLLPYMAPYRFKAACSPHLACRMENKKIVMSKIINSFKFLANQFEFVIVEGIGGALVPFSQRHLVIDIVKKLDLPVLIVAANKLGAINQALLTIEALNFRKIKILGIVFNNVKGESRYILEDNPRIIKGLTKQEIFGVLPWQDSYQKIYKRFIPIGERILKTVGGNFERYE